MFWQIAADPSLVGEIHWSTFRLGLLLRTLLYNAGAAAMATFLAVPAALVIGRGRGRIAKLILLILPLAVLMPSVTYTYAWVQVFRLAGIVFDPASAADVIRCIWTLAAWLWPLPAIAMGLSLRFSDLHVEEQALLDGAVARITARRLLAPALGSLAVVTVLAMQEFAVYERTGISVISTEIRTVFETGSTGLGALEIASIAAGAGQLSPDQAQRSAAAVATAIPMIAIIALLATTALWAFARAAEHEQFDTGPRPDVLAASPWLNAVVALLLVITLALPIAALIMSISRPVRLDRTWTVLGPHVIGSMFVGGLTAAVALLIAALGTIRPSRGLLIAALITFLIGGELLAIANIRIYNRTVGGRAVFNWIYNTPVVVVVAYIGRFGWLALLSAQATWTRPWQHLRDLAATDGAGPLVIARKVIWPMAWPVLIASALLVFVLSMTEVSATVLLSPQRPQMLVPLLMSWIHMLRYDDMLEGSLLLMAAALLLGAAFLLLSWLGMRGWSFLRRMGARSVMPLLLLATMMGCDDGTEPDAVWLETGTGRGQTVYPRAITHSPHDDTFFVVDRMARVQRLDARGKHLNEWRMPDFARGKPVGLSVGPDKLVYIADTHYARVMVYHSDGTLIRQWGSEGTGPGQFIFPTDVAFDSAGNVYVGDYGDHDRIQVFTPEGTFLRAFGSFGEGPGQFSRPQSLVIHQDILYIADACNHRIAVFKTDGTFLRNMGSSGPGLGEFRFPYGLDIDSGGRLVVAEFGNNRIQWIDKDTGKGLRTWGVAGREPGQLAYPWALAVNAKDDVVVVDSGNNRLQVIH